MGEVYRARDTRLSREVAIKVLPAEVAADASRVKRFEKEASAGAAPGAAESFLIPRGLLLREAARSGRPKSLAG